MFDGTVVTWSDTREDYGENRYISDFSDIPELDEEFWREAEVKLPDRTEQVTLRVKGSVLAYFKASGKGYQTRINQVLESYVRRKENLEQSPALQEMKRLQQTASRGPGGYRNEHACRTARAVEP